MTACRNLLNLYLRNLLSHQYSWHETIPSAAEHMQNDMLLLGPGVTVLWLHIAEQQAPPPSSACFFCKTTKMRSCQRACLTAPRKSSKSRRCLWFLLHDSPPTGRVFCTHTKLLLTRRQPARVSSGNTRVFHQKIGCARGMCTLKHTFVVKPSRTC